jgi:tape measure domain-containing protein
LDSVGKTSKSLAIELNEVNKSLKLDPGNADLASQKMTLLGSSVDVAKQKLDILQQAYAKVKTEFDATGRGEEQLRLLERQISNTSASIKTMESTMDSIGAVVENQISPLQSLQRQLQVVDEALKLEPGNTDLIAQKHELLAESIQLASDELKNLKNVQADAMQKLQSGEIGIEEYQKLGKQIEVTSKSIDDMGNELTSLDKGFNSAQDEAEDLESKTKELESQEKKTGNETKIFGEVLKASLAADAIKAGLSSIVDGVKAIGSATIEAGKMAVNGFTELVKSGVSYNAQIESYVAGFTTLTGSAEKAAQLMEQLKNFGATTPFELPGLAESAQKLMAFGIEVEQVQPVLSKLGDIALGDQEKLNGLTLVFGQVSSQGKLTGQDLAQFINQGFNPLNIIAEKTGESMTDLKDRMSEGKISFNEVAEAINIATNEGGLFFNAMDNGSRTMTGQLSNMQDGWNAIAGAITDDFQQAISKSALPAINELIDAVGNMVNGVSGADDELKVAVKDIGTAFQEMSPMIAGMVDEVLNVISGLISELLPVLQENMPLVVTTLIDIVDSIVAALMGLLPMVADIGLPMMESLLQGIVDNLGIIIEAVVTIVSTFIEFITDNLHSIIDAGMYIIESLIIGIIESLPMLVSGAVEIVTRLVQFISANMDLIAGAAVDVILALVHGISDNLPSLVPAAVDAVIAIVDALIDNIDLLIDGALALIIGLAEGLIIALPRLVEKAPEIVEKLVSAIIENIPKLMDAAVVLITMLAGYIEEMFPKLLQSGVDIVLEIAEGIFKVKDAILFKLKDIIESVFKYFSELDVKKIGIDMINGIVNGLIEVGTKVKNTIMNIAMDALNSVKSFFGIQSPSKVMADMVGKPIAEGMALGISNGTKDVDKAMSDMGNAILASGKDIAEISADVAGEAEKAIKDNFKISEEWIEQEVLKGNLSIEKQAEAWREVANQYAEYSDQKVKALKEAQKLDDQIAMQIDVQADFKPIEIANKEALDVFYLSHEEWKKAGEELDKTVSDALDDNKIAVVKSAEKVGSDAGKSISDAIRNKSTEVNNSAYYTGKSLVDGLESGIRNEGYRAIEAAEDLARQVAEALNNTLDIHSPSKLTQKIGAFLAEGLSFGMIDNLDIVRKASEKLGIASVPKIEGASLNGGSGEIRGAGSVVINNNITVKYLDDLPYKLDRANQRTLRGLQGAAYQI